MVNASRPVDVAVVGKGLIGSAAARYLASAGERVLLVGPDEPRNPAQHRGVFSSHYDQGRLTRLIGRNPIFARLAERSIERYGEIEAESGIRFHFPVGGLIVETPDASGGPMQEDPLGTARTLGRRFTLYDYGDRSWRSRYPFFELGERCRVIDEPAPAGYINPRELVAAQVRLASRAGADVHIETVVGISRGRDAYELATDSGAAYRARRVLVAAGAFTGFNRLLPVTLPFRLKTETVLLAGVSDADAKRLSEAPTVIALVAGTEIWDLYMTPPIRYPDGRHYVKLGANSVHDFEPRSLDEVARWFRSGESDRVKPALTEAVRGLWPGLEFQSFETKRCILCRTPSGFPVLDEIDDGLFVAAGGNGGSAKSSDALGRLASDLMRDEPWPNDLPRELFRTGNGGTPDLASGVGK